MLKQLTEGGQALSRAPAETTATDKVAADVRRRIERRRIAWKSSASSRRRLPWPGTLSTASRLKQHRPFFLLLSCSRNDIQLGCSPGSWMCRSFRRDRLGDLGCWAIRLNSTKQESIMKPNRTSSSADMFSHFFAHIGIVAITLAFVPPAGADVLDGSLIVRFNFDAEPVGDVIVDTSPAGGHPGANLLATWQDSEVGRTGVMSFDGTVPSQITLPAALDLNSSVGAITFWMKSDFVTPSPNPYAIIFDRRGNGGD